MKWSAVLLLALAGCSQAPAADNVAPSATPSAAAISVPAPVAPAPRTTPTDQPFNARQLAETPAARNLPAAVQHFIADYEQCEHWAGEEPYDAARRKEIEDGVKASCTGIDARLARLTAKYSGEPAYAATLDDYAPVHM